MMRQLTVFSNVSLDGYFSGPEGDASWLNRAGKDPGWDAFGAENARSGGELLFGRVTYEMMSGYWPTPAAAAASPELARHMNELPKTVFSRTLETASWNNTRLMKGDLLRNVRRMKDEPGPGMVVLGSGSIVAELAAHGVIDEYQIFIHPTVLGGGRTLFGALGKPLDLKVTKTHTFGNGIVQVCYRTAG